MRSTANMRFIAENANTPYTLIYTKYTTLSFVLFALERMEALMEDTQAAMVYSDHFNQTGETRVNAPVIDYQLGALRDDFDFGSVLFYRSSALKEAVARMVHLLRHVQRPSGPDRRRRRCRRSAERRACRIPCRTKPGRLRNGSRPGAGGASFSRLCVSGLP